VFRRTVETATNGEIEVDITWNIMDEGRPNTDLFELVESGHMFLCYFSSSYLGWRVPELNVLETPFLFQDLPAAHRALDGALGEKLTAAVRDATGFEALGFWDNGFRHLTNRLRPVRAPADCKGMTVRLQPNVVHEDLIRSWGAIPVAVELSRGIQLITRLDVDAQENPLANTVAYGVDQVHGHVTMTGHLYGARGLFAHRPTWESFTAEIREIVGGAVRDAIEVQRTSAARLEADLRSRLMAAGVEFVDLTPEEKAVFVEASAPAIARAHEDVPDVLFDLARR
jgi:TRAP-type C4-dicarboxylate transport system substrate-binding protein